MMNLLTMLWRAIVAFIKQDIEAYMQINDEQQL